MNSRTRLIVSLCLSLCCSSSVIAQTPEPQTPPVKSSKAAATIIVAPTERGLRFTALGAADKLRLEVFDANSNSLLDTGFRPGSLLDWTATDSQAQPLPDGTYTCVVTAHELAGSLRVKQGSVTVQSGRALLELPDAGALTSDKQTVAEQTLTPLPTDDAPALTVTAHTGRESQIVSTRGGFSFRTGNLFAGLDREVLHVSAEGNMTVTGTFTATKGIEFADGTVQTTGLSGHTDAQGNIVPATAGAGTQNHLAKWTDNSGTWAIQSPLIRASVCS
jgi:hypothetical protein